MECGNNGNCDYALKSSFEVAREHNELVLTGYIGLPTNSFVVHDRYFGEHL